jgi:hypothetical protein
MSQAIGYTSVAQEPGREDSEAQASATDHVRGVHSYVKGALWLLELRDYLDAAAAYTHNLIPDHVECP